jgi:hypothetical protein
LQKRSTHESWLFKPPNPGRGTAYCFPRTWFENPGWHQQLNAAEGASSTDYESAGMDKVGRNDVASLMKDRLVWFLNGKGERWKIEERPSHE